MKPSLVPILYAVGIAGGFGMLAWLAYLGHFSYEALAALTLTFLGGLIRHVMPDGTAAPAAAPASGTVPVSTAGRSSLAMMAAVVGLALGLAMLGGCAAQATSWYVGVESAVHDDIARTADATAKTLKDALCDTPASVLQRDVKLASAREQVCGPIPSVSSISAADLANLVRALQGAAPSQ